MKFRAQSSPRWLLSVGPGTLWQFIFLALPFCAILAISFLSRGEYGEVERPFTLENYKRLAGFDLFGFDPLYPRILLRSFVIAALTALASTLAALPLAFFIVRLSGGSRTAALILLTIPVWTNLLVRTYAWQLLLGANGWISRAAVAAGFLEPGQALYPSAAAVFICLVCDFLPFAVLPVYASLEKLDHSLIDAARDLGASRPNVLRHAIYPQIRTGLFAGLVFVFLPATGQFIIPDLLGGARTVLIGNVLQQQFGQSRDWPFGAAFAAVVMLVVLGMVFLRARFVDDESA